MPESGIAENDDVPGPPEGTSMLYVPSPKGRVMNPSISFVIPEIAEAKLVPLL